eukprot:IDg5691t1
MGMRNRNARLRKARRAKASILQSQGSRCNELKSVAAVLVAQGAARALIGVKGMLRLLGSQKWLKRSLKMSYLHIAVAPAPMHE